MKKMKIVNAFMAVGALCLVGGVASANAVPAKAEGSTYEMVQGLSIRGVEPEGLRFIAKVPDSEKTQDAKFGMVMLPATAGEENLTVSVVNGVITPASPDAAYFEAEKWYDDADEASILGSTYAEGSVFTGVLINPKDGDNYTTFPASLYNTPIVARGFKVVGDTVTYTNTVSKSIGYVATVGSLSQTYAPDVDTVVKKIATATWEKATLSLGTDTIRVGAKYTPVFTVGGMQVQSDDKVTVTYSTNDTELAKVVDGKVECLAEEGEVEVTATLALKGGNSISKKVTLTCAPSSFSLTNYSVVGVNENVDLKNSLTASEGTVAYAVAKDAQAVDCNDGVFTPTAAGQYDVTATTENESFTYSIWAVDKATNPTPNGQMTEANNGDFTDVAIDGATKSYVNETFDGRAGTSVKYTIPVDASMNASGAKPISFKPTFPKAYYETLYAQGYTEYAIRMKTKMTTNTWGDYFLYPTYSTGTKITSGTIYLNDGTQHKSYTNESSLTYWNMYYQSSVGFDAWLEVVLPLHDFIQRYDEEATPLMYCQFQTMDTYEITIDSVYAVKKMSTVTTTAEAEEVEQNSMYDVYTKLGYQPEADVDASVIATLNGESVTVPANGKIILEGKGMYTFKIQPKNRYAAANSVQQVSTGTPELLPVAVYQPTDGTYSVKTHKGGYKGDVVTDSTVGCTFDNTKAYDNNAGSIKISSTYSNTNYWHEFNFVPANDKAYYQGLADAGYTHISFYYQFDTVTANSGIYMIDNTKGGLPEDLQNTWTTTRNTWQEEQIDISYFIDNWSDSWTTTGIPLYVNAYYSWGSSGGSITYWFGGCYAVQVANV